MFCEMHPALSAPVIMSCLWFSRAPEKSPGAHRYALTRQSVLVLAISTLVALTIALTRSASAQGALTRTALTRSAAITSALRNSPQAALAAADTASAFANIVLAHQWDNPTLNASVSMSVPTQHYSLDIPLDAPWIRTPRIAAADAARSAAQLRFAFATRAVTLDADTAYTQAQLSTARARLSQRTSRDADSLLVLARIRREAGDASELDVELATVFAGQAQNTAGADSITAQSALLRLQTLIGLSADSAAISVVDSLMLDATDVARVTSLPNGSGTSLLLGAASNDVTAATSRVLSERRKRLGAPSLSMGFEAGDPDNPGPRATAGISIPLPLFNRNRAALMSAQADLARAESQRRLTLLSTSAAVVAARRDVDAARLRATRSARLVASADRISALSLLAYREGASTLLLVLDAQRTARETLAQYFDDVAASRIANSVLRLLTTPAPEFKP